MPTCRAPAKHALENSKRGNSRAGAGLRKRDIYRSKTPFAPGRGRTQGERRLCAATACGDENRQEEPRGKRVRGAAPLDMFAGLLEEMKRL